MASAPERLFFEDLQVGESFMSGSYEMTQERILSFASEFDPQPFHTDPDAAQETFFAGLAASGWHTCAVRRKASNCPHHSMLMGMRVNGQGTRHPGPFEPAVVQPPKRLLIGPLQQRLGLVEVEYRDIDRAQGRNDMQAGERAEVFDVTHKLAHAHQVDSVQGQGDKAAGRLSQGAAEPGGNYHDIAGAQRYGSRNRRVACHTAIHQELAADLHAREHQRYRGAGQ